MECITQLGYLGLSVSNIGQWEQFATQTLGLQISGREADGTLLLRNDEYHRRLLVHPTGKDDLAYIGWEVTDEHALSRMAEQLKAAGTEVRQGTPAEGQGAWSHQPAGVPGSQWHPDGDFLRTIDGV